jgi:hypothetical protein
VRQKINHRVHPIFTDQFLASLNQLPPDAPLNRSLFAVVDLTLEPREGLIAAIAIVRTSRIEAFDAGVVDALRKAAPFGAAPVEILSEDGKVHLQWVLHRNPEVACSTYFMQPLLLKSAPSNGGGVVRTHSRETSE